MQASVGTMGACSAVVLLSLLQSAMGSVIPVEVCAADKYKMLLRKAATNFEPWKWSQQEIMAYVKADALKPALPIAVLLALCVLTLLAMVLWRCVRFCCVVCCHQQADGQADKVLWGKKLRVWKVSHLLFALACAAVGAWGMASVPRDIAGQAWAVVDDVQTFAGGVAGGIERVSQLAVNMTLPLDDLMAVITRDVDPAGLRANATRVASFLDNAPSPAAFKAAILALNAALAPGLRGALATLRPLVIGAGSPLTALSADLAAVAAFTGAQLTAMNNDLGAYSTAVQAAAAANPPATYAAPGTPAVNALVAAQANAKPATWEAQLSSAIAAVTAIQGMTNNNATNPFSLILAAVTNANNQAMTIRGTLLPTLLGDVNTFNNLFYHNASYAIQGLIAQAEHIDAVVVALPNNTVTQIAPLKDALAQLDGIYSATPSPLTLATDLASLNNQLALPGDVAQLTQQLQSAAAALDGSAQSLADLNSALTTVKSLVQAMDADTTAIGSALSAYVGSGGPWSNVQSALNAGAPHIAAAAAGVSALQSITGSASTKLAQLGQQIDGTAAERQGVADAVTAAVAAIDGAPNTSGFVAILDSVQPAYAALGPTPSQALSGVTSLLDTIDQLTTGTTNDIKRQIGDATGPLDNVAAQIRSITSRVDGIQQRFTPIVAKYQNYAYSGLMAAYALVMLLVLLVALCSYRNCPAGVCLFSFVLTLLLILFCALPLVYTVTIVALRDGCANVELIVADVATNGFHGAGGLAPAGAGPNGTTQGSAVTLALDYYFGDPKVNANKDASDVLKSVIDLDALKAKINSTVDDAIAGLQADYTFRPAVADILSGVSGRVASLLTGMDTTVSLLNFSEVRPIYEKVKGLLCCLIADDVYFQWVATLAFGYLAWLATACALVVLRKLDSLADGCCGCVCFNPRDYQPSDPLLPRRPGPGSSDGRMQLPGFSTSEDGAVVAQITIGGFGPAKGGATKGAASLGGRASGSGASGSGGGQALHSRAYEAPQPQPQPGGGGAGGYPAVHLAAGPVPPAAPHMYPDVFGGGGSSAAVSSGAQYPQVWSRGAASAPPYPQGGPHRGQ